MSAHRFRRRDFRGETVGDLIARVTGHTQPRLDTLPLIAPALHPAVTR